MLETWYNIKDKQPDLKYKQEPYEMTYSDPILVMLDDELVFARFTNQKFYGEDENGDQKIYWDLAFEFAEFDLNIFDSPFDTCMGLDEALKSYREIYWSPLDKAAMLLSIDSAKKRGEKDDIKATRNIDGQGNKEVQDT